MQLYCDESGGISAGAMTFAAVAIEPDNADALLRRYRATTGLRGEMKGSRMGLTDRALFFELLERFGGRAQIGVMRREKLPQATEPSPDLDLHVYSALLEDVVTAWLPESGGCSSVIIDEGRYDERTLALVRNDIAALLGTCGRARLEDSKRSSGIQIADVISNSIYNLAIRSIRAQRIEVILDPFFESKVLRARELDPEKLGR